MKKVNLANFKKIKNTHGKEIKGRLCDIHFNNIGQWTNTKQEQQIKARKTVQCFPLIS